MWRGVAVWFIGLLLIMVTAVGDRHIVFAIIGGAMMILGLLLTSSSRRR